MPPLPSAWVDSLFARLTVSYGRAFLSQYEGIDIAVVKADWAQQLAGFARTGADGKPHAPAISFALENLQPGRPPDAMVFRQWCRAWPEPEAAIALPPPARAVPERFKTAMAQLAVPLNDDRPEKVRIAARFIALWGNVRKLNPRRTETLAESRQIVADYEAEMERKGRAQPANQSQEEVHAEQ